MKKEREKKGKENMACLETALADIYGRNVI